MSDERNMAALVAASGYSLTTVRKWWKRLPVRERTHKTLQATATELNIRRPRQQEKTK